MHEVLAECETPDSPMVISGCVGPRGDGYQVGAVMSPEESAHYHEPQLRTTATPERIWFRRSR